MGRTEFLPRRLGASPGWQAQTIYESEMALFNECMWSCVHTVLDTADIVRDGDLTSTGRSLREIPYPVTRPRCTQQGIFPWVRSPLAMGMTLRIDRTTSGSSVSIISEAPDLANS